jgi:hypothetical protein
MTKQVGRLALRVTGEFWHAYYAMPNTMKDAIWLGSIRMVFIQDNEKRKQAFMDMMKDCIVEIFEDKFGEKLDWPNPPIPAPESERSGEG